MIYQPEWNGKRSWSHGHFQEDHFVSIQFNFYGCWNIRRIATLFSITSTPEKMVWSLEAVVFWFLFSNEGNLKVIPIPFYGTHSVRKQFLHLAWTHINEKANQRKISCLKAFFQCIFAYLLSLSQNGVGSKCWIELYNRLSILSECVLISHLHCLKFWGITEIL